MPFTLAFLICRHCQPHLVSLLLVPIVKLPGSSLAVATLGFNIIIYLVMLNEDWATGGSYGLLNVPLPRIFGYVLTTERDLYFLCLLVAALVYLSARPSSPIRAFGRALKAISQDEDAARACGISVIRYKSKCFLVAAFTAGIAGSLYAHHARYLNPNDFTFNKSIEILIMVVVGGLGSLPGAVIGAIVVVLMPEFLRSSGELRLILFGLLVVVLMGVSRGGIAGLAPISGPARYALSLGGHKGRRDRGNQAMTALLRTEHLSCRFGGLVAVAGVDLEVQAGDVHGLIGPNGAGKTTFLNLVSGHIRQTGGTIYFDGENLGSKPAELRAAAGIRRTFQNLAALSRDDRHRECDGGLACQYAQRCFPFIDSNRRAATEERETAEARARSARFRGVAGVRRYDCRKLTVRSSAVARNCTRICRQAEA